MKHVNFTVQGDTAVRQGQSEQGEHRESTTAVQCKTHHRESCSQFQSIQETMQLSSGASRWSGHQEQTITANIENETAMVESISWDMASERRQPILAEGNRHTASTTGIDAAVSQAQQTAQQQFQPQAQPQQFQTTFDDDQHDEQHLESETDQHRGEQDRQRHCRQQAGKSAMRF